MRRLSSLPGNGAEARGAAVWPGFPPAPKSACDLAVAAVWGGIAGWGEVCLIRIDLVARLASPQRDRDRQPVHASCPRAHPGPVTSHLGRERGDPRSTCLPEPGERIGRLRRPIRPPAADTSSVPRLAEGWPHVSAGGEKGDKFASAPENGAVLVFIAVALFQVDALAG